MKHVSIFVTVFIACCVGFADSSEETRQLPLATRIAATLKSDAIRKVEIFHIDKYLATIVPINEEYLENEPQHKITYARISKKLRQEFLSALEGSPQKATKHVGDLRWGCAFYDCKNRCLLKMYFNGDGSLGVIDGQHISSCEPIVKVLEARCSCLWDNDLVKD